MRIVIVYHSGYGHTKIVAEHIQKGASIELEQVKVEAVKQAESAAQNVELARTSKMEADRQRALAVELEAELMKCRNKK